MERGRKSWTMAMVEEEQVWGWIAYSYVTLERR